MGFLVMVAGAAAFGTSPVKVVQQARERKKPAWREPAGFVKSC